MTSKTKTATAAPATKADEFGLPVGVVLFSEEQVATMLSLTKRQLRRYRTGEHPTLPCFRPSGPQSPPMYRRSDLVAWLER